MLENTLSLESKNMLSLEDIDEQTAVELPERELLWTSCCSCGCSSSCGCPTVGVGVGVGIGIGIGATV